MTTFLLELLLSKKDGKYHGGPILAYLMGKAVHGASEYIVTLLVTSPLTLANSLAKALTSLIQYGATTQPSVDYLATVTQSGAVEQRNIPQGYTELDKIIMTPESASDFSQALDTGLKCTEKTEIRCGFKATDSTNRFVYGASTSNARLTLYRNGTGGNQRFGNEIVSKSISSGAAHDVVHNATALTIDGVSSAYAAQSAFTTADNITIGNCNGNTGTPPFLGEFYYYQHIEDGVLLRDYVPATDGTHYGLYDKVNGTFLWAVGITGGNAITPTPDTPMDLVCNNGKVTGYRRLSYIESTGTQYIVTPVKSVQNSTFFLDFQITDTSGSFLSVWGASDGGTTNKKQPLAYAANGWFTASLFSAYGETHQVARQNTDRNSLTIAMGTSSATIDFNGTQTTVSKAITATDTYPLSLFAYNNKGTVGSFGKVKCYLAWHKDANNEYDFYAIPAQYGTEVGMYDTVSGQFFTNAGTGSFTAGADLGWLTIGDESTITDADGHIATLAPLLAVGTYKDTQEVIAGAVTRNVGVKVLTGEEGWYETSSTAAISGATTAWGAVAGVAPICTQLVGLNAGEPTYAGACRFANDFNVYEYKTAFGVSDITEFKAKLAAAYVAGTPVILLFAKATPTTESVSPQLLTNAPLTTVAEVTLPAAVTTTAAVSTPDPNHPLPLWCNNGELKLSPNLFDASQQSPDKYYTATGSEAELYTDGVYFVHTGLISCLPNTAYTISGKRIASGNATIYACTFFDEDKQFISRDGTSSPVFQNDEYVRSYTTPANARYFAINKKADDTNVQIEKGSSATTYRPYGTVYADGTPETLTVRGKNLFDKDNMPAPVYTAYISNQTGAGQTRLVSGTSERTVLMPIEPNTTYTVTKMNTDRLRIAEFSTIPNISPATYGTLLASDTSVAQRTERTITTGATAAFLAIQICNGSLSGQDTTLDAVLASLQVELGSTATAYEPYVTPQTVTNIPNKLAVGTYKDEYEFVSGLMTHRVGIKVLTGTENWTQSGNLFYANIADDALNATHSCLCTHFVGISTAGSASYANEIKVGTNSTANAFWSRVQVYPTVGTFADATALKAYLAAQYDAGTPVIIVYPLATATTEQLTPHALSSYDGTTVIDATSGTDNSFEVTYSVSQYPAVTISVSGTTMTLTAPNELDTITQSGHTLRIT